MGFAVKADRDRESSIGSSKKQNLVLLHPVQKTSPKVLFREPVRAASAPDVVPATDIKQLPKTPRLPLGLKLLVGVQQGSTLVTGGLVVAALVIYSWTVYLDKTVSRAFQRLETLKVSTQQVTTANETLKHSMAQQAELPTAGFKPFEPDNAIFLAPASPRPSVEPSAESEVHFPMPHPLGY
ncbi:MAG: hypothetical protein AAGA46_11940 [Cyanobacteria bacterium P01_F01_bin.13]